MSQLRSQFLRYFDGVGVPILFFSISILSLPIAETFQFNPDEGIELAKVSLYTQGFSLYTEIWNDQPPFFTLCLSQWWQWFGPSIYASRLLTLSFATVLVWTFYRCLRLNLGIVPALLGTLGLGLTYDFLRLSVSVMRGLPAISLAMLAVYGVLLATRRDVGRGQILLLLLSGLCFGLSLQTKFFTVLMIPAIALQILGDRPRKNQWSSPVPMLFHRTSPLLLWFSAAFGAFMLIGITTHALNLDQLWSPHVSAQSRSALTEAPSWLFILLFLVQDLDYVLLAGLAARLIYKRQVTSVLFPLFWLLSSILGLLIYQPIWSHYSPMIAIPVTWLAAYALPFSLESLQNSHWYTQIRRSSSLSFTAHSQTPNLKPSNASGLRKWATGLLLFAFIAVFIKFTLISIKMGQFRKDSLGGVALIQQVQRYQPVTQWILTDLPILAFYTQLKVPPETVVFSAKRLKAGDLTRQELLHVLDTYHPEQVVLGLYPEVQALLEDYLEQNYTKIYQKKQATQYLLNASAQHP